MKIIGSAAGLAMGMSGNTHYAYEDIAIMRTVPNMVVVSPADAAEAYLAVYKAAEYDGPVYIRLTGNLNEAVIHENPYNFEFGRAEVLKEGKDVALFATGCSVAEVLKASEIVAREGISVTVVNMHTIKPLDTEVIAEYLNADLVVTVEEHSVIGGLGGAVAEYLASVACKAKLLRIGLNDCFVHPAEYGYLKEENGLSAEQISKTVMEVLEGMV